MKTRGIRGGVLLSLDSSDDAAGIGDRLAAQADLLRGTVIIEVAERLPFDLVEQAALKVRELGGSVTEVRPAGTTAVPRGESQIINRTVRSGAKVESTGSIVVLGDVNSGAELIAADDIIVLGSLRGLAHAGAAGNEKAVIWAQEILSPQLRIGAALAQAGGGAGSDPRPELAHLRDGNIVIKPWD